ncbi:MAG: ABC transporter permease [Anaerolineae bacterium]
MRHFAAALWVEMLKARRSRVPLITGLGFLIAPIMGGFFMIILKDPERARQMGLISTKAQLTVGTADWPAFLSLLAQATAVGGAMLFAIIAIWIFGREFSDRTVKEILALPTPRSAIVTAKFVVSAAWCLAITILMLILGMLIGGLVNIPGWSAALARSAVQDILLTSLLTITLLPYAALFASAGRGYLPAFGWTILTIVLAQVAALTGWGDWFPWSIPALFSGAAGPRADLLGIHSYVIITLASLLGLFLTFRWWRDADQTR